MKKYEIKGGLRPNLEAKIKALLACPIHNQNATRMSRESFIRICLAVQEGKQDCSNNPHSVFELPPPDNSVCKWCKIGLEVRSGTLFSEPEHISWISNKEENEIRKKCCLPKPQNLRGYKEALNFTMYNVLGQ